MYDTDEWTNRQAELNRADDEYFYGHGPNSAEGIHAHHNTEPDMTRSQLQNLIDQAWSRARITTADALTLSADMRNPNMSVADILAAANTAIQNKCIADGTVKATVDAELAAAIGLSTTL
jgi:hypothetical protein